MPLDAWLLLVVSVGLGLTLELLYIRAQRALRARAGTSEARARGENR